MQILSSHTWVYSIRRQNFGPCQETVERSPSDYELSVSGSEITAAIKLKTLPNASLSIGWRVYARVSGMGRFALLLLSGVVLACLVPVVEALDETFVASEAQFAVEELRGLSDSGVYDSLSLAEMLSSSVEDGTYHSTTTLNLALQSP